jgi:hypothetical protein
MLRLTIIESSKDYSAVIRFFNPYIEMVELNQNGAYSFVVYINNKMKLEMDSYKFEIFRDSLNLVRPLTVVIENQSIKKVTMEMIN